MKHRDNVGTEGCAVYLTYCGYKMTELDEMTDDELRDVYCKEIEKNGENLKAMEAKRNYCISFM